MFNSILFLLTNRIGWKVISGGIVILTLFSIFFYLNHKANSYKNKYEVMKQKYSILENNYQVLKEQNKTLENQIEILRKQKQKVKKIYITKEKEKSEVSNIVPKNKVRLSYEEQKQVIKKLNDLFSDF